MSTPLRLTVDEARQLAVTAQGLQGPLPGATDDEVLATIRRLGCVQIDPTRTVERTQHLVLWSRHGRGYDQGSLHRLAYERHDVFEHWAHEASYVLSEELALYRPFMRGYLLGSRPWQERSRQWLEVNDAFRRDVIAQLRAHGPLPSRELADTCVEPWPSSGWTNGRNVTRLLDFLSVLGEVLCAGRRGNERLWDLGERCLPPGAMDRCPELSESEMTRQAAVRAIRMLGVATARQIPSHFTRGRYPGLPTELAALVDEGVLVEAQVGELPGTWYLAAADLPVLDALRGGGFEPRTVLLSPFDNLICDRTRTEALWDFRFRLEIYTPVHLRQYGFYVLPVLHGDRLVARLDLAYDRKVRALTVKATHVEPGVRMVGALRTGVKKATEDLEAWLALSA